MRVITTHRAGQAGKEGAAVGTSLASRPTGAGTGGRLLPTGLAGGGLRAALLVLLGTGLVLSAPAGRSLRSTLLSPPT